MTRERLDNFMVTYSEQTVAKNVDMSNVIEVF